ncbi:MAG: FadR family transcriptional regulator [Chloroflexi bacterium]|nr:FadR family transcriptional regulator [Chloroflexota bacterium]
MPLQPIQRASIIESVTEQLLSLIRDGSFRPGDRFPSNRQLATTLAVGRSTVREAIQRLVMLRVLEARQGKGVFVRRADGADAVSSLALFTVLESEALSDVVEAREVLEVALAGFAAQRATEADLRDLQQILRADERAGELDEGITLSTQFHLAVAHAAHSPVLEKLFGSITDLTLLRQRDLSRLVDARPLSLAGHRAIFDAIAHRDPVGARHAASEHMAFNRRLIQAKHDVVSGGAATDQDVWNPATAREPVATGS